MHYTDAFAALRWMGYVSMLGFLAIYYLLVKED